MDEVVRAALARWPDVPDVFGWLSLDARGRWRVKGERIAHPGVVDFIGRNYACDDRGRWFFQNGPQRVFVRLDVAPWVVHRVPGTAVRTDAFVTHTGMPVDAIDGAWLTDDVQLLVGTPLGIAGVDDRDLDTLFERLLGPDGRTMDEDDVATWSAADSARGAWSLRWDGRAWPLGFVARADLPSRFGFDPAPVPAPGQPDC